jgi:clathrin heavy chain
VVHEYTGKVDQLMSERKEQEKEKISAVQQQREQEAQRNAYATLLPLALPAPPLHSQHAPTGGHHYGNQAG